MNLSLCRTGRIQYFTWRTLVSTARVLSLREWHPRRSCSIRINQWCRLRWTCLWAWWGQVASPFFKTCLWGMFAELPGREGLLSVCGGCLDSCYICTYPPFHCECPFTVFHKMHRKPQDGNGRVSHLLASLPLIHASYPFINVHAHEWENTCGLYSQ